MPIAQKFDVIGRHVNQIWDQDTKVSLNQVSNSKQQRNVVPQCNQYNNDSLFAKFLNFRNFIDYIE